MVKIEKKENRRDGVEDERKEMSDVYKKNDMNEENIILHCLRNILKSASEKNRGQFLLDKKKELKYFIEKNSQLEELENERHKNDIPPEDDVFFDLGQGQTHFESTKAAVNEGNLLFQTSHLKPAAEGHVKRKENRRKSRKRNYIDIEKVHFDFEKEDFLTQGNDELVNIDYLNNTGDNMFYFPHISDENSGNTSWDDWINLEDDVVKEITTPPKIPFNENFRKMNKDISEMYIKKQKEEKTEQPNLLLNAQLNCLVSEDSFEMETYSISQNFDKLIMQKLQLVHSLDDGQQNLLNTQNKNLSKLLEHLMSWYFAGFYIGRMSCMK